MIIRGKSISLKQVICLIAYYGFAQYLPESHTFCCVGGGQFVDFYACAYLKNVANVLMLKEELGSQVVSILNWAIIVT